MRNALILAVVVGVLVSRGLALAAPDPVLRCKDAKVRAITTAFSAKLRCHAAAVLGGSTSQASCLAHAQQALVHAFARAESRGGCTDGVPVGSLGTVLDSWVAGAVATFAPPTLPPLGPPSAASLRCARAKIRAVSQAFAGKLRCHAAAVLHGASSEAACRARAQSAFAGAFARVEARGGCAASVDAATFGSEMDLWVASAIAALAPPPPTPTPGPTPTPTAAPTPTSDSVWACCQVNHPELGSCNGGVTGPPGSPLADAFRSFCQGQGGTWTQQRCTVAQCGVAVTCCATGGGSVGSSEYFGSPDPAAIAELCAINGGTVLPGACPLP